MSQPLYAGLIAHKNWEVCNVSGKHEPLVDLKTHYAIQDRCNDDKRVPARKDIKDDFPMRGFVTCGSCEKPLTSCWSKGRHKKYPYYLCDTKGCADYRKSIRKEAIEGEFEDVLKQLTPSRELFALALDTFRDSWNDKLKSKKLAKTDILRAIKEFDNKSAQLIDRLVDSDSNALIKAYEARLQDMERQKITLHEKLAQIGKPIASFDKIYRTAFEFLANPRKLWGSRRLEDKRAVLKLVFAERLPYHRNKGYRTAKTSMPFKALGDFSVGKCEMVIPTGFEPVAY